MCVPGFKIWVQAVMSLLPPFLFTELAFASTQRHTNVIELKHTICKLNTQAWAVQIVLSKYNCMLDWSRECISLASTPTDLGSDRLVREWNTALLLHKPRGSGSHTFHVNRLIAYATCIFLHFLPTALRWWRDIGRLGSEDEGTRIIRNVVNNLSVDTPTA